MGQVEKLAKDFYGLYKFFLIFFLNFKKLITYKKVPDARVLSSPSGAAKEDNA